MITTAQLSQYKVAVIGLGLTGISCARFLQHHDIKFALFDTRSDTSLLKQIPQSLTPGELVLGLSSHEQLDAYDALIVSPGISLKLPLISKAIEKGKVLISDIDLLNLYCDAPIVAITGTNGKSTVTSLAAKMLEACGKQVLLGGNIGIPVLDALLELDVDKPEFCVLELSSFQLERCQALAAVSSVVLNISEDHLDRYDDLAEYIASKQNIYTESQNIVVNLDEPAIGLDALEAHAANKISFSLSDSQADFYYQAGRIYYRQQVLLDCEQLQLKGLHNIANIISALALISPLIDDLKPAINAASAYAGLPHRCQFVANIHGVDYINDSKATNEGASIAAIEGLLPTIKGKIHLILGGEDKGALFEALATYKHHEQIHFYLFGRCKEKLAALLELDSSACYSDLGAILQASTLLSCPQDLVLFSPACASFDMFKNFEHRGDVFMGLVKQLEADNGL